MKNGFGRDNQNHNIRITGINEKLEDSYSRYKNFLREEIVEEFPDAEKEFKRHKNESHGIPHKKCSTINNKNTTNAKHQNLRL